MRVLLASSLLVCGLVVGCSADMPRFSAANHDPVRASERREAGSSAGFRGAEEVSDLQIRDAIRDELLHDPSTNAKGIDIHVEEGTVILTGVADDSLAHHRAISVARQTLGVRAVVDNLSVSEVGLASR